MLINLEPINRPMEFAQAAQPIQYSFANQFQAYPNWRFNIYYNKFLEQLTNMNLTGPQPMKQDIAHLTQAINQMTVYKPDRPTDLFQFYHPQIRKHFVDAYNLCRLWVENLLYWKGLYPQEAFETKTAYARKLFVVKSKLLRQYLDQFFQSVCQNFQFVDFVEVQLYKKNQKQDKILVQKERFYFSFTDKFATTQNVQQIKRKGLNTIQKEIQFKRFLGQMEQELKKGINCREDDINCREDDTKLSYRLYMGYKWDQKGKNNRHRMNLLQKWTQVGTEQQMKFETTMINHACTGELQLVCERYVCLS